MQEKNKESGNRVKRRSFLYYMGGISLAAVSFARNPFKFFGGKVTERALNTNSMKVKPNPDAVKRNSEIVR